MSLNIQIEFDDDKAIVTWLVTLTRDGETFVVSIAGQQFTPSVNDIYDHMLNRIEDLQKEALEKPLAAFRIDHQIRTYRRFLP